MVLLVAQRILFTPTIFKGLLSYYKGLLSYYKGLLLPKDFESFVVLIKFWNYIFSLLNFFLCNFFPFLPYWSFLLTWFSCFFLSLLFLPFSFIPLQASPSCPSFPPSFLFFLLHRWFPSYPSRLPSPSFPTVVSLVPPSFIPSLVVVVVATLSTSCLRIRMVGCLLIRC